MLSGLSADRSSTSSVNCGLRFPIFHSTPGGSSGVSHVGLPAGLERLVAQVERVGARRHRQTRAARLSSPRSLSLARTTGTLRSAQSRASLRSTMPAVAGVVLPHCKGRAGEHFWLLRGLCWGLPVWLRSVFQPVRCRYNLCCECDSFHRHSGASRRNPMGQDKEAIHFVPIRPLYCGFM